MSAICISEPYVLNHFGISKHTARHSR